MTADEVRERLKRESYLIGRLCVACAALAEIQEALVRRKKDDLLRAKVPPLTRFPKAKEKKRAAGK